VIDLHSHLLPGVDDGSRSVARSVAVLKELAALGLTDICLTPHLTASRAQNGIPPAYDAAFAALQEAGPAEVRLHRGAEIMLDRPFSAAAASNRALTLGGSRYVLVEFPRIVPRDTVLTALSQVVARGLVPVIAHPERYSSCSVGAADGWRRAGAKLQVDATTLLMSSVRGDRARQLVAAGLADILAADNHGDDRSQAGAAEALAANGGQEQAELLTVHNPRAILEDRELQAVEPLALRTTWARRLRRFFEAGEG
jgi:protein-tyrosine phosphatase